MHHRRAFTLVELLVVIAVIAILVALLLPAVHSQAAWYGGKLAVDDPIANLGQPHRFNPVKLTRITDGLSHTILVSEQAGAPTRYSGQQGTKDGGETHSPRVPRSDLGWCTSYLSAGWTTPSDSDTIGILNDPADAQAPPLNWDNCEGLFSFHRGVNATHCDGSVRFLAENIHPEILIALLTRAEGD